MTFRENVLAILHYETFEHSGSFLRILGRNLGQMGAGRPYYPGRGRRIPQGRGQFPR